MDLLKEPHTALFTGQTGCGKTEKVLRIIETYYKHFFDYIVILSPTLGHNKTYHSRKWFWQDDNVYLLVGNLLNNISKFSNALAGCITLFIVDDMIADEQMNKRRSSFLEMAISGRHRSHYLWILTQAYTAVPKNVRRQAKMIFVWLPKDRNDLKVIMDENDCGDLDVDKVKNYLRESKYACLIIRMEYPRKYYLD